MRRMKLHIAEIGAANYFCSGLNDPKEPMAVALAGYHVGISCDRVSEPLLRSCEEVCRNLSIRVFVDSGAFAEVAYTERGLVTKNPISDREWLRRLEIYLRLAKVCGGNLYLVAPDRVGCQLQTLVRLNRYSKEIQRIRNINNGDYWSTPKIIVPVQTGVMEPDEYADAALWAIGMSEEEVVWGIPSKKEATTLEQIRDFVSKCFPDASFHLLGMGPASPRFEQTVQAILDYCPEATITCDAVRITALVGRKPMRAITHAQDEYRQKFPNATGSEVKALAIQEVLGDESEALLKDNGWRDRELLL